MDDDLLISLLNRIGKRVFVEYFDTFSDERLSGSDAADRLPPEYTLKSRISRVSKARRILREGAARQALEIVAGSEKVDPAAARRAREILARR